MVMTTLSKIGRSQVIGIAQVEAGQLADPLQPVFQRAAVHGQRARGGLAGAAVLEVLGEGLDQSGAAALVVIGQGPEPLVHKALYISQIIDGCQEPEHVEVGKDRGPLHRGGGLLQAQRQARLTQRLGQLRRPQVRLTHAHPAAASTQLSHDRQAQRLPIGATVRGDDHHGPRHRAQQAG
jgi:hypothetical protein